jgi:integrase
MNWELRGQHPHLKNRRPLDRDVLPIGEWLPANLDFYRDFRRWLRRGGYGESALNIYGTAARLALGWLDTAYWEIDPQTDLERVREYVAARYESEATRESYFKGVAKLAEYLGERCGHPEPTKDVRWDTYIGPLPGWLASDVRIYVGHRARTWLPEDRYRSTVTTLSHLTLFLRWAAEQSSAWELRRGRNSRLRRRELADLADLTPDLWFDYLDERLRAGRSPVTVNVELRELHQFLRFHLEQGRTVCRRTLRVATMKQNTPLPRDVPLDRLRVLLQEIDREAGSSNDGRRRLGVMDRAWVLLMLHSGLRTGEVRRLRVADLDLENRRARIEQSKGLKDRIVWLSGAAVDALGAWIELGGRVLTDRVFAYRHQPLSASYCYTRLRTYGRRCGIQVTPHRLRHSCATLLLNAGAPVLMVQAILGHRHIDTTLQYARLYDSTVARDYYLAMDTIESSMDLEPGTEQPLFGGRLLALVDSLQGGTLNMDQRETVHALRTGILALMEQEAEAV